MELWKNGWIELIALTNIILLLMPEPVTPHSSSKELILNGREIRVPAYDYPPLFTMKKQANGSYVYGGMAETVAGWISDYFNVTIKYVPLDPSEIAKYGLAHLLKIQIYQQLVDIVLFTYDTSEDNLRYLEICYPFNIDHVTLLQPWPREESRLKVTARPYTGTVWLCLLLSTIAFIGLMSIITMLNARNSVDVTKEKDTGRSYSPLLEVIYQQFEYVIRIVASQGEAIPYTARLSLRIVVASWILSMVVIVNAWVGVLTSILAAAPKLEKTVDSLEELANHSRFRLTVEDGTSMSIKLLNATSGYEKALGDTFRQEPKLLTDTSPLEVLDNVLRRDCAYLGNPSVINYFIAMDLKSNNGKCRMTISSRPLSSYVLYRFGIPKGTPYLRQLESLFIRLWDRGLTPGYMINTFIPFSEQCRANVKSDTRPDGTKPFTLIDLTVAFFIFGIGLSASALSFVLEVLIGHCIKRTRQQKIMLKCGLQV